MWRIDIAYFHGLLTHSLTHSLTHWIEFVTLLPGCVGFKPKDNGLLPITVDKLGPWIFVNLGHSPTGTCTDWIILESFWHAIYYILMLFLIVQEYLGCFLSSALHGFVLIILWQLLGRLFEPLLLVTSAYLFSPLPYLNASIPFIKIEEHCWATSQTCNDFTECCKTRILEISDLWERRRTVLTATGKFSLTII